MGEKADVRFMEYGERNRVVILYGEREGSAWYTRNDTRSLEVAISDAVTDLMRGRND